MSETFSLFCAAAAALALAACGAPSAPGDCAAGHDEMQCKPGCHMAFDGQCRCTEPVSCPPGGTALTWENFGQAFVGKYCLSCHSQAVSGPARQCAPAGSNFDTVAGVHGSSGEILEHATGRWAIMPPQGIEPSPTVSERQQLGLWVACGAPSAGGTH